jgi:hypothetical protein
MEDRQHEREMKISVRKKRPELLTALLLDMQVLWDVTPYQWVCGYRLPTLAYEGTKILRSVRDHSLDDTALHSRRLGDICIMCDRIRNVKSGPHEVS